MVWTDFKHRGSTRWPTSMTCCIWSVCQGIATRTCEFALFKRFVVRSAALDVSSYCFIFSPLGKVQGIFRLLSELPPGRKLTKGMLESPFLLLWFPYMEAAKLFFLLPSRYLQRIPPVCLNPRPMVGSSLWFSSTVSCNVGNCSCRWYYHCLLPIVGAPRGSVPRISQGGGMSHAWLRVWIWQTPK